MTKEQNKNQKNKIYTPQTLKAINKHLRVGDLLQISITTETTYQYVRIVMCGNRNQCVCRQGKSQEIVLAALALLDLREKEAKAKLNASLEKLATIRNDVSSYQIAVTEIQGLLAQPSQNK